ncbi:MAG TPA: hypothetical protein VIM13_10880 [Clostridia bacterium]
MKAFKLIYLLTGILLAAGVLFTSLKGLPEEDLVLYEKACELEDGRLERIWPGLSVSRYPVAIRKGYAEYVVFNGDVRKRKPVLPVIACTAYPSEDAVYILVPSKSVMDSVGQIVEGFSGSFDDFLIDQFSIDAQKLSDNQYISVLCHEAMHALQLSRWERKIMVLAEDIADAGTEAKIAETESDPEIRAMYEKQADLLYRLVVSDDGMPDAETVKEYIRARKDTQALLSAKTGIDIDAVRSYADLYELLEGTARYVEAKAALALSDNELYGQYLSSLKEISYGREKYYMSGMGICMLLDRLDPVWKQDLSGTGSLSLAEFLENLAG